MGKVEKLPSEKQNFRPALIIMTTLFFMWGFITSMNDILIPYLKKVFELTYTEAALVQFCFFGAYFIGSVVYFWISARAGDPIARMGYKNSIIVGLMISALGCVMFYPAAALKLYGLFLAALFILGLGFTLLQIAANPYVAVLGKPETASSRLNLSQALNSFGTTVAPILGGFLIFHFFANMGSPLLNKMNVAILTDKGLPMTAAAVQIPYLIFTALFVMLAVLFRFSKLPQIGTGNAIQKGAGALKYPHLVLGMVAIFFYVGAEVSIGSFMINYIKELLNYPEVEAKYFLAFYWGGAMIGRFAGSIALSDEKSQVKKSLGIIAMAIAAFLFIFSIEYFEGGMTFGRIAPFMIFLVLNFIGFRLGKSMAGQTLMVFALVVIGLLITTLMVNGAYAMWAVVGIGLFNSIMWSNIFTLAIEDLGEHTSQGSSLLVMMILGGALIPLVQGAVADASGIHFSFFVPIFSYIYLAWYGWKGHAIRRS